MPDAHLNPREIAIIEQTARAVMQEAGHICHFDAERRRELHELTDEGKDRVKHLIEIADAANLVGIESDGHIVLFSVGRQVTVIGQKAISAILITVLIFAVVGIVLAVGWRPLCALIAALKS